MVSYGRATGTRDFLPKEMTMRNYVEQVIRKTFEKYGFQQIQTPIFEEFDLFALRSGEQIRESMFTFYIDEKEYALRPELTAAVCRVIAMGKMQIPKPFKVYYIGQCFRYERPQAGRYREFWQAGLELMGTKSPLADAEVMTVAMNVLDNLGLKEKELKVGNIGIFRDILAGEGFNEEFQNKIISDIDRVMSITDKCKIILQKKKIKYEDIDYVKVTLGDLYEIQEKIGYSGESEIIPPKDFTEDNTREWLNRLPRISEETYKFSWIETEKMTEDIANLITEIAKTQGRKKDILDKSKKLLIGTNAEGALNELLEILDWLEYYGVNEYTVILGKARGLDFYTGTVFEIDCPLLGAQKQICGGGRYDCLVSEFGGPDTPATGFAFGMDRIVESLEKSDAIPSYIANKADIVIATTSVDLKPKAVEIAEQLRILGKRTEVDMMDLDLKGQLGYASDIESNFTLIIGPDELKNDKIVIKNMKDGKQKIKKISELSTIFGNH